VQSRGASYRAALTAVVTYSVTDYQHHFNINATSWRIPQNEHASERKKRIRYCYPRIIQSPRRSSFIIMRNICMEDRWRCFLHYGKGTGRLEAASSSPTLSTNASDVSE